MLKPVFTNPWVRAASLLVVLAALCFLIYLLSPVLVPLFFAFLVAYVLDPLVDVFERWRIPRGVSIAALALAGLALVLVVPIMFIPALITEADGLIEAALAGAEERGGLSAWFYGLVDRLPLGSLVETLGWQPDEPDYDPLAVLTVRIAEQIREPAIQFMKTHAAQIASAGESAGAGVAHLFSSLGRWLVSSLLFVGNFALFAFVAAYLLKDFDAITRTGKELIPPRYRKVTVDILTKIDGQVRGFLRGQMVVCACLGLMYAIGLYASGVPFALLIGVFGAVASFVPYLGLVLTIGPALVLCVVQHQGIDGHLLGVAATFGIAQFLEGTVLTPKIVGEQVGLSPVWVMLAILVFGNALGFLGLLLAVPIAASLKVLVVEALAYYKASPVFEGPPPEE